MRVPVQHAKARRSDVRRRGMRCGTASPQETCGQANGGATCQESRSVPPLVREEPGEAQGERSGAEGRFFITPHAVHRFRERVSGERLTYEQALGTLIRIAEGAHRVMTANGPKLTNHGFEVWRSAKPERLRLWVSTGGGGKPQLVTVLRAFDRRMADADSE